MSCTVCDLHNIQNSTEDLGFPSYFEESEIRSILNERGITEEKCIVSSGSNKGDNYVGVILRVRSHGTIDGKHVNMNFVYKTAPTSDKVRNTGYYLFFFDREFFSYEKILPAFEKLQSNENVPSRERFVFPKLYRTIHEIKHEGIIMEDLSIYGFIMADRFKSLDWAQVELVLTNLAKLHALSYVMKTREPEAFSSLAKGAADVFIMKPDYRNSSLLRANGFLDLSFKKALNSLSDQKHVNRLSNLEKGIADQYLYLSSPQAAGDTAVICHGDTWTNNYLFKYNEANEVIDLRMIDWQMTRYASPLTDILYMVWTSTHGDFRKKYYDRVFDHYHSILGKFLERFSLNVENFYPRKKFTEDRRKFAPYGLYWTFFLQSVITSGVDDTSNLSLEDVRDKIKDGSSYVTDQSNALFIRRVNEIAEDYVNLVLDNDG